jgi:hypothetical protein
MYVRRKKHRSGTVSVVVVSKSSGKYKEVKHVGTINAESGAEIELYALKPVNGLEPAPNKKDGCKLCR